MYMNQEIDNQLLLDVLNKNKKSEKIFIDLCNPIIWGALKRFDQLSYEDKEDLIQNLKQIRFQVKNKLKNFKSLKLP